MREHDGSENDTENVSGQPSFLLYLTRYLGSQGMTSI
jgi:hypothetical protein